MHRDRWIDAVAVGLAAIPILAAVALWPTLPEEMAVHWGPTGPDWFLEKPLATLGLFAFAIATIAFVRLAPDSITNTPGGTNPSVLFLGFTFGWVEGLVVVWNLGIRFPVELAVLPVVLLAGLLVAVSLWGR
ncbi:MAG: DUF1648 domain-containing protein [Halodesulfurarchaeum sp.]